MDLFKKEIQMGNIIAMEIIGSTVPPETTHPTYIVEYDKDGKINGSIKRYDKRAADELKDLGTTHPFNAIIENHILMNVDTLKHKTVYVTLIKKPIVNFN